MESITNILNILPVFFKDALFDSLKLVPVLFLVFVFIEIFESYFSKKIDSFLKYSKKLGPVLGALFAIVPQCGFSVIAATLYIKRFISTGTLVAVFIATSDEAIPILLSEPNYFPVIIKIIFYKLLIAILVGYGVDYFLKDRALQKNTYLNDDLILTEKGCCDHELEEKKISTIFLHPIKHTLHIFFFIFGICVILNFLLQNFMLSNFILQNPFLQPVAMSIVGLIPNCAISVLITMLYIKGVISFGSVMAGLCAGGGLGLLVLLRNNLDRDDNRIILEILLFTSIIIGILFQVFYIN